MFAWTKERALRIANIQEGRRLVRPTGPSPFPERFRYVKNRSALFIFQIHRDRCSDHRFFRFDSLRTRRLQLNSYDELRHWEPCHVKLHFSSTREINRTEIQCVSLCRGADSSIHEHTVSDVLIFPRASD